MLRENLCWLFYVLVSAVWWWLGWISNITRMEFKFSRENFVFYFFYLKRKRVQRLFKDALIISIGQDLVKQFWIWGMYLSRGSGLRFFVQLAVLRRFFETKINQIIYLYLGYRLEVRKVGPWWRRWSTRNHWRKSRGTRQTSRTTTVAAALDQILYLRKTSPSSAPPGSCSSSALA